MHKSLFVGRDVALDHFDGGHPVTIVTFEARDKSILATKPKPFGSGFGRGVFAELGLNEFLVKRSWNHWYQTAEMLEVAALINAQTRGTKVITYGGSMGGFAAINFAPMLNAYKFIALSAPFDVRADNVLNDNRWTADTKHFSFLYNFIRAGACRSACGYAFYCSVGIDGDHAKLIGEQTRATLVPVDYGGHPCSFYLNDTYKLKQLVSEIAFDQFDVDRFYAVVREKTPDTYYPHYHESVACAEAGDIRGAIRSIRTAVSCKPSNARLHARHAELLLKNKDSALARTAFETAIQLEPKDAHYRVRLSHACAALNDWPEAVHQMEIAVSLNKMKYEYHARLSECLIKAGALAKAEASMAEAVRLAPEAENPRLRLAAIRRRLAIYSRLGLT